jgi:hypothetical protein
VGKFDFKNRPTAWRSADWPTLQYNLHYTYSTAKEHTNENTKPKANSAAAPGWAVRFPVAIPSLRFFVYSILLLSQLCLLVPRPYIQIYLEYQDFLLWAMIGCGTNLLALIYTRFP